MRGGPGTSSLYVEGLHAHVDFVADFQIVWWSLQLSHGDEAGETSHVSALERHVLVVVGRLDLQLVVSDGCEAVERLGPLDEQSAARDQTDDARWCVGAAGHALRNISYLLPADVLRLDLELVLAALLLSTNAVCRDAVAIIRRGRYPLSRLCIGVAGVPQQVVSHFVLVS